MLPKALRDLCARIPVLAAAVLAPAALLIAPVAGADLVSTDQVAAPVSDEALPCCAENLQAPALEPPADLPTDLPVDPPADISRSLVLRARLARFSRFMPSSGEKFLRSEMATGSLGAEFCIRRGC